MFPSFKMLLFYGVMFALWPILILGVWYVAKRYRNFPDAKRIPWIFFLPFIGQVVWYLVGSKLRIGSQSMSNLIEVFIAGFIGVGIAVAKMLWIDQRIKSNVVSYLFALIIMIACVFLLRVLMPYLPE